MSTFRRIALALLVAASMQCAARTPPPLPTNPRTFELADGSRAVAGIVSFPNADSRGYAYAVWKVLRDGTPDRTFNGNGFTAIPIWGYYEGAGAIVEQSDGKLLVLGVAADPTDPSLATPSCHPSYCGVFPAILRLNRDGTLDYGFNRGGKVVLDYPAGDAEVRIVVRGDGMYDLYDRGPAIGRLRADGTIDRSAAEPYTAQLKEYAYVQAQGMWSRVGAGAQPRLAISQQGDVVFGARFAEDADGTLRWTSFTAIRTSRATYHGIMYATSGPPVSGMRIAARDITVSEAGSVVLRFENARQGSLEWSRDGTTLEEAYRLGEGPASGCAYGGAADLAATGNLTDFWFAHPAGSETGWGVFLADHGGQEIQATWFTYDQAGQPIALVGMLLSTYGDFSGTVAASKGIDAILEVDRIDGNELYFGYRLRYASRPIPGEGRLTRMVYREPGTACR